MEMDNKQIYHSLMVIVGTCSNMHDESRDHEDACKNCPMGNDEGKCRIVNSIPVEWKLKKPGPPVRIME